MGSVRTPIIGRPRPLPSDRRAQPDYTLNCEEPVIPLQKNTVKLLTTWIGELPPATEGPLFPTSAGAPLTRAAVAKLVARHTATANERCPSLSGKNITPHTLRHTSATRTLRATGNLRIVQDNLGHARLETTRIYTHVQDAERQAAAEALPPVDGQEEQPPDPLTQIAAALAVLPREDRERLATALQA